MHANAKQKTKQDYSKIAQVYIADKSHEDRNFELIDKLVETLKKRRMMLKFVLDLGCGPGTITDRLIKEGVSRLIAIDITPEFCDYVREKFRDDPIIQLDVVEGDMVDVVRDFLKGYKGLIAAVTAGFSIIHIPDKEVDPLLKNIHDLLYPGGMFYMSCYEGKHKGMEIEPPVLQHDTRTKTRERLEVYMNYFTEEELRKRLENVGFDIIDLIHHKPEVLPGEIPVPKLQVLAEKPLRDYEYVGDSESKA